MNPWEGKQIWIWELDRSGPVDQVVSQAVSLGLAGLIVKGWDGAAFWPQIGEVAKGAHAAGLIVGAWGYSYGRDPAGEAVAARQAVAAGADWLVIDAEAEYEGAAGPAMADGLKAAFQGQVGHAVPIAYTSFGLPEYHSGFPFASFAWCSVALPQVYWGEWGLSAVPALTSSLAGYRRFGLPVAPVGQLYGSVAARDIMSFLQVAANASCPGVSFFNWQEAGPGNLAAVGVLSYERGVDPLPEQWKVDIVKKAMAAGLISQDHDPDAQTAVWFVLQVALNALALVKKAAAPQYEGQDAEGEGPA